MSLPRRAWPVALVAALAAAACGGGSEGGEPTCHPSGTSLEVTAEDIRFDTACLAAPSGQAFTITLENRDGDLHNVAIYPDDGEPVFRGEIFGGPDSMTYRVPALQAGVYEFRCDVHPQMTGAFVVE